MKNIKRLTAFMAALFICVFSVGAVAFAADTAYASTWKEYSSQNSPAGDNWTWNEVYDAIEKVLLSGQESLKAGDSEAARQAASDAYYGYYETTGFERIMNGVSGARVSQVELAFTNCRTIAKNGGTLEEYTKGCDDLLALLKEDANSLDGVTEDDSSDSSDTGSSSSSGSGLIFAACFGIILREGFEAILIVGAIIAYLQVKTKEENGSKKKQVYPVYIGSLLGIAASFGLAALLNVLLWANNAQQEIIEGITALLAVCVLFYVCNWMLSKSETEAWTNYIKNTTKKASERGSIMTLAFTAFLAVFREGAEVVLFFQPYVSDKENAGSVWAGLIVGAVCLVFVYMIIHFLSVKIPIRPFFTATSILMAIMCVSFVGGGIKELIEGGVFSSHSPTWLQWIPYNDTLAVLGIYPILETLIPQIVMTVVMVIIFRKGFKKNKAIRLEAQARRAAEEAVIKAREAAKEDAEKRAYIRSVIYDVLEDRKLIEKRPENEPRIGEITFEESALEDIKEAIEEIKTES